MGGSVIAAFFLAHNYVSEQFGNYVEYGILNTHSSPGSQTLKVTVCFMTRHSDDHLMQVFCNVTYSLVMLEPNHDR